MIGKFLTRTEIFELMSKCNREENNILQTCILSGSKENLKILWTEIEKYFTDQNFPQNFKKLVKQRDKIDQNILYDAAWNNKIEVHETLWELLPKLFEDREELYDFILQKDLFKKNFVHELVSYNKNPAIIELTFKILKENFSETQFQEILKSKGFQEMNLLQSAAYEKSQIVRI